MLNPIEYIRAKIREYDSEIDTRPSSSFYELFIMPISVLVNAFYMEITGLSLSQSIKNYDIMTEDELDPIAANQLIERRSGGSATGAVNYYFSTPRSVTIPAGSIVEANNGSTFSVELETTISEGEMSLNKGDGLYYIQAQVIADGSGEEYNVLPGEITKSLYDISGIVKVSNPLNISGGAQSETNEQLYERAKVSASVRNLLNDRSINATILEDFEEIRSVETIGKGDPEMLRDTQTVLIGGFPYEMNIGGCVDIYADTGTYETVTIDIPGSITVPMSNVRVESYTGYTGITTDDDGNPVINIFNDGSSNFDTSGVTAQDGDTPGDTLEIFGSISSGSYEVISIENDHSLKIYPAMFTSGSSLSYRITKADSWKSPVAAIESIEIIDPTTMDTDGSVLGDGVGYVNDSDNIIERGSSVSACVGDGSIIATSYTNDDDVWLSVLNDDFTPFGDAIKISSSGVNSNPSITSVGSSKMAVCWENVSDIGEATIRLTIINYSTLVMDVSEQIVETSVDGTSLFHSPKIGSGDTDVMVACARVNTAENPVTYDIKYSRYIDTNYEVKNTEIDISGMHGNISCKGLDIGVGGTVVSVVGISDDNYVKVVSMSPIGFIYGSVTPLVENSSVTRSPSVSMSPGDILGVTWVSDEIDVMLFTSDVLNTLNLVEVQSVATATGLARNQSVSLDETDKIHISFIDENNNSGDVHYLKLDHSLNSLVTENVVHDQYRNSSIVVTVTDQYRRPTIIWDSMDLNNSRIDGCKKISQDYFIESVDPNKRYSPDEIVNLKIDSDAADGDFRVNYYYPADMSNLSEYVASRSSIDRVIVADYLVKTPIPCFIDISMEYTGNDDQAVEQITDYINNLNGSSLYVSDILSSMDISVAERVTLPLAMSGELHDINGSVSIINTQNGFDLPRTVRYTARNIEVV